MGGTRGVVKVMGFGGYEGWEVEWWSKWEMGGENY